MTVNIRFLRIPFVSKLDDHNLFKTFFQTGAAFVYRQRSNFNSPSINHTVERPRHQRIGDNDDDHDDHNQCIFEKGGRHHHAAPPNSLWNIKFQIKIKTKQRQGNNKKSHSIRWDQYQNLYWWTPPIITLFCWSWQSEINKAWILNKELCMQRLRSTASDISNLK